MGLVFPSVEAVLSDFRKALFFDAALRVASSQSALPGPGGCCLHTAKGSSFLDKAKSDSSTLKTQRLPNTKEAAKAWVGIRKEGGREEIKILPGALNSAASPGQ